MILKWCIHIILICGFACKGHHQGQEKHRHKTENITLHPLLSWPPELLVSLYHKSTNWFILFSPLVCWLPPREQSQGHEARQLPGRTQPAEQLSQAAGSPARSIAAVGSGQPHGDARATIGIQGPTTRCSNFSTNSLASIWGRRLLCRRRQPAASGRAPTTATANPWWDSQRATAWGHSRELYLSWQAHEEPWQEESNAGPEVQARSHLKAAGTASTQVSPTCHPRCMQSPRLSSLSLENSELVKMMHSQNPVWFTHCLFPEEQNSGQFQLQRITRLRKGCYIVHQVRRKISLLS